MTETGESLVRKRIFINLVLTNHFLFMRKILGIFFLLAIAAYIKFGNTVTDVDYKIKISYGELPTQLANMAIVYHVPDVVRIAGADLYRPEGYFTHSMVKNPRGEMGQAVDALVKTLTVGVPAKLDSKKAKMLGLEPQFSFWEEKGKWVLLFGMLLLLYAFFWR